MVNGEMPDDLVMDILARLPVKSLIRFRCVCKSWYALILNPNFVTQHSSHPSSSQKNDTIIFISSSRAKPNVSLLSNKNLQFSEEVAMPFFEGCVTGLYIYGPCDGIVCLYGPCIIYDDDDDYDNDAGLPRGRVHGDYIALWNPATREFKALPLSCVPLPPGKYISSAEFGIGFDFQTNDYKVVRISNLYNYKYPHGTDVYQVEVYTLSTNSWRKVVTSLPATICLGRVVSAYLSGFYYWWAKDDQNVYVLLSFDMSNEVFQKVLLPPDVGEPHEVALVECNGSISLCRIDWCGLLTIWVMNEDGVATNKWIKQLTVEIGRTVGSLLGLCKNGDVLIEDGSHIGEELVSYCPSTGEFGHHRVHGNSISLVICKESLVSLSSKKKIELGDHEDIVNSSEMVLDQVYHTEPGPSRYELLELNLSLNCIYSLDVYWWW